MKEKKVSAKGAVIIPAYLRKKLGIIPGRKVAVTEVNGKVQIIPLSEDPVAALKGSLKTGKSMKALLMEAREKDAYHEKLLTKGIRYEQSE